MLPFRSRRNELSLAHAAANSVCAGGVVPRRSSHAASDLHALLTVVRWVWWWGGPRGDRLGSLAYRFSVASCLLSHEGESSHHGAPFRAGEGRSASGQVEAGLPIGIPAFLRAWAMTMLNWAVKSRRSRLGARDHGGRSARRLLRRGARGELSSVLPVHAPAGVGTYAAAIVAGAVSFGAAGGSGDARDARPRQCQCPPSWSSCRGGRHAAVAPPAAESVKRF